MTEPTATTETTTQTPEATAPEASAPAPVVHPEGTAPLAGSPGAFVFASAFGPRIPLAPPDEGGSGGGAEGSSGGSEDAGAEGAAGGAGDEGGEAQKPARPEYIPENFWDAEAGFKADDFNALLARDAERTAQLAQVPESADNYEVKLPHDFKLPEGFELKDGESPINPDDPRVAAARDFAHANQMSQAQFENLVAMGFQMDVAEAGRLQDAMGVQVEALGIKGKERIGAVKTWISSKLPAKQAESLLKVIYTKDQVEGFEALMRQNRGAVPGSPGAGRDGNGSAGQIEGYDQMNFRQRMAAIDAIDSGKR